MPLDPQEMDERLAPILQPEPDEDGWFPDTPPHPRLQSVWQLDASYWSPQEFSTGSRRNRLIKRPQDPLSEPIESLTVPWSLFWSALQLFGQSLTAYSDQSDSDVQRGSGPFRYFPSILMTYWAGFEALIRFQSECLVQMVPSLAPAAKLALLEREEVVDDRGVIKQRSRRRPVLERYWLLLKCGYRCEFDRGSSVWQSAVAANRDRDQLVHYEVAGRPTLTCETLLRHMEAITLLLIAPSVQIGRSVYSRQFDAYDAIAEMQPLVVPFEERPLYRGWPGGHVLIPCTFDGVDEAQYPMGGSLDPEQTSLRRWRQEEQRLDATDPTEG
jgi:hypothetical protein